jgi:hypothetical protein
VRAYADGFEVRDLVVTNGEVELPFAATTIFVGLPYVCELETLPPTFDTNNGSMRTHQQTFAEAVVRTKDTRGLQGKMGTAAYFDELQSDLADGALPSPHTGSREYTIPVDSTWSTQATFAVRQEASMPAHILSIHLEPDIADS